MDREYKEIDALYKSLKISMESKEIKNKLNKGCMFRQLKYTFNCVNNTNKKTL